MNAEWDVLERLEPFLVDEPVGAWFCRFLQSTVVGHSHSFLNAWNGMDCSLMRFGPQQRPLGFVWIGYFVSSLEVNIPCALCLAGNSWAGLQWTVSWRVSLHDQTQGRVFPCRLEDYSRLLIWFECLNIWCMYVTIWYDMYIYFIVWITIYKKCECHSSMSGDKCLFSSEILSVQAYQLDSRINWGWSQTVNLHYVTPFNAVQSCKALSKNEMKDGILA